ncbi:copper amine oxidase N-terminal domain-containing protein [Paenibacillus daejeonensis]|uniref:copper amine oxidase N-terminal domain-containing protein n=1 Tax=Paenibacillus daejeonensis TaxID=135193 RepID=UPI000365CD3E|nr:copper amine oxidase N-terminal domain-containing protein [Paenibacillus daejeonensis]
MKLKKMLAPVLSMSLLFPAIAGAQTTTTMAKPTVESPAVELRAGLDYLLSEHYVLAVSSMTKAYGNHPGASAAQQALEQNAKDMVPAIESIYGAEGAAEFDRIFSGHTDYTVDIVNAKKANDATARAAAEAELEEFVVEFGDFLGAATEGKLPAAAAKDAVRLHEQQVVKVFDEYVAGNYASAFKTYREGLAHMFVISDALSTAVTSQMPTKFNFSKPDTPAGDLRSALNHLAAEHYAFAAMSMQLGYDRSPAYQAWLTAEAGNTADFKAAIASIYGNAGAAQFEQIWLGDHINAQDEIVKATLSGDSAAIAAARAKLDKFATEFGNFLGAATEQNLPAAAATGAVKAHEELVLQAFDRHVARDYTGYYASFREGYAFMFGVGKALGGAIVNQMPDKFQTGTPTPQPEPQMHTVMMKVGSKQLDNNGAKSNMDVAPLIMNGTTYIPLRYLAEGIGAEVKWDAATKATIILAGSDVAEFWINQTFMELNDMRQNIGSPVIIKDGRTLVPVRFIAELFGWNVQYNATDWSIWLTKKM